MVGKKFTSNSGDEMEIIENLGGGRYKVRFAQTSTETVATLTNIKKGAVKDRYAPTVAGVGYLGGADTTTFPSLYARWKRMLQSCYDPLHVDYSSNGAKGVVVQERWFSFENYQNDILELLKSKGSPTAYRIFKQGTVFSKENILIVASR